MSTQNSRCQRGDMKEVPYWDPANIRRHGKKGSVYPFGWNSLSLYGRAECKAHNASWNLSPISLLVLGRTENKESLNRVGGSQDLPDVQRLLGSNAGFKSKLQALHMQLFYFISVQNWGLVCNEIVHKTSVPVAYRRGSISFRGINR